MDWTSRDWFGLSGPKCRIGRTHVRAWNCFRRVMDDGTVHGVGVGQVGSRHLLYLGSAYGRLQVSVLFFGETE